MPNTDKVKNLIDATKKALKKKDDEIRLLKKDIIKANGEKIVSFKMPDSVEVRNFPPRFMVHVDNQPLVQDVKIINAKDLKFPGTQKVEVKMPDIQAVEVKNHPEQEKLSDWLPKGLAIMSKNIMKGISDILSMPINVRLVREDKIRPIFVTPVDENGNVIRGGSGSEAISRMMPMLGRFPPTFYVSNGGGSGRAVVTADTPARLLSAATPCTKVIITSLFANAGLCYVGINSAAATGGSEKGVMISPGGSVDFGINDVSKVWYDGTNTSDVLTYTYQS